MKTGQETTQIIKYKGFSVIGLTLEPELVTNLLEIEPRVEIPPHYNKGDKKKAYFILEGFCMISVNDVPHMVKAGDALSIKPGEVHSITTGDHGVKIHVSSTEPAQLPVWTKDKPEFIGKVATT